MLPTIKIHELKLDERWQGPYRVREKPLDLTFYLLEELDRTPMKRKYAGDQVKKYCPRLSLEQQTTHQPMSSGNDDGTSSPDSAPVLVVPPVSEWMISQDCIMRSITKSSDVWAAGGYNTAASHLRVNSHLDTQVNPVASTANAVRSRKPPSRPKTSYQYIPKVATKGALPRNDFARLDSIGSVGEG
jgi:hypothetical protein